MDNNRIVCRYLMGNLCGVSVDMETQKHREAFCPCDDFSIHDSFWDLCDERNKETKTVGRNENE